MAKSIDDFRRLHSADIGVARSILRSAYLLDRHAAESVDVPLELSNLARKLAKGNIDDFQNMLIAKLDVAGIIIK